MEAEPYFASEAICRRKLNGEKNNYCNDSLPMKPVLILMMKHSILYVKYERKP